MSDTLHAMASSPETFDLIEWRWDREMKAFRKYQSHLTNTSKTLCYGTKIKLKAKASRYTVFTVKPNGYYQYINQFKPKKCPN